MLDSRIYYITKTIPAMAHPLEIILITNSSPVRLPRQHTNTLKRSYNLLQHCSFRKEIIRWLYEAENQFKYSRSTHYLTLSVLDRLIISNFSFDDQPYEVYGATILLLCSKFNQNYPLSLKMLEFSPLMRYRHSSDDFIEMQGKILQKLQYNIVQDYHFYQNIAFLEEKLRVSCKDSIEKLIESAINHPHLYRYGRNVLLKAIEHLASRTVARAEYLCDSFFMEEVNQIISELMDLHFPNKKPNTTLKL